MSMIWSASQSNVADQEKGLRVGVDPGGLLDCVCCCHLPAEVAAVEEEVVGGRSQLEPLLPSLPSLPHTVMVVHSFNNPRPSSMMFSCLSFLINVLRMLRRVRRRVVLQHR